MIETVTYDGRDLKDLVPEYLNRIVILVFSSPECENCQKFWADTENVSKGLSVLDVSFVDINTLKYPQMLTQYAITATPTFLMIADGAAVGRIIGFESASNLTSKIRDYFIGC